MNLSLENVVFSIENQHNGKYKITSDEKWIGVSELIHMERSFSDPVAFAEYLKKLVNLMTEFPVSDEKIRSQLLSELSKAFLFHFKN